MNSYYTVQLTGGTSTGLYTIYFDTINSGSVANQYPSGTPATNLTLAQLIVGVIVSVPDVTTKIYIYNESCHNYISFQVAPPSTQYPCICITDVGNTTQQYVVCYSGDTVNGKPQYVNSPLAVTWNTNGYWELSGDTTYDGTIFRSTDYDNIPDSNWGGYGPLAGNHTVTAQIGDCGTTPPISAYSLILDSQNASCAGNREILPINDGTITVQVSPFSNDWTYSLDGITYQQNGYFYQLSPGPYTVYAKDLNNNIITDTITVLANPATQIYVNSFASMTPYGQVGNMVYYQYSAYFNTQNIPVGTTVNFDLELTFEPRGYEPGTVLFDYSNKILSKNGGPSLPWTLVSPLNNTSVPLTCNPIYNLITGNEVYSTSVSLVNGDSLTLTLILGVDVTTNGSNTNGCVTQGQIFVSTSTLNTVSDLDCSSLYVSDFNSETPLQIWNP